MERGLGKGVKLNGKREGRRGWSHRLRLFYPRTSTGLQQELKAGIKWSLEVSNLALASVGRRLASI